MIHNFEVTNERSGKTRPLELDTKTSIPDPAEINIIITQAFNIEPSGDYSVNTRGKARRGNITVYAS